MKTHDYIVIGAGIVGMTIAREIQARKPDATILILEKEPRTGMHASGRNSGVVHAGIYYPPGTLKAKLCVEGHRLMLEYLQANNLPHQICGKVIVAPRPEDVPSMELLFKRAITNGVKVERLTLEQLSQTEPSAHSHEWAIWSPNTAILDSKAVLAHLEAELRAKQVEFQFGQQVATVNDSNRELKTQSANHKYKTLINASGVHCDRIAHQCHVGLNYRILPFKGSYWKASEYLAARVKGLIYPVPDLNVPFLGVHITKTLTGQATFGPSAMPALGRENYSGLKGIAPLETLQILARLAGLWIRNQNGFRAYVKAEVMRLLPGPFFKEAKGLIQDLKKQEIGKFYKAGIRPQLYDTKTKTLQMDFVVEQGENSIHVLNAISPAFTCSFAFAKLIADRLKI